VEEAVVDGVAEKRGRVAASALSVLQDEEAEALLYS
jgi:hypothetical protein